MMIRIAPLLLPLLLSGCVVAKVAETAVEVATLPVKAVAAGVDAATTSQSEADQKRGRELRKADEAAGRAAREREAACAKAARAGTPCPPAEPAQPPTG